MRDGAALRADRYVAKGYEHAPVVVMRTPYGRRHLWRRLYCLPFARRGLQVVIQRCRGTEDSQGDLVPFAERDDGADTVAWLREQPWYPGRFATFGPSYWGLAQWAVAAGTPDDLVAMVPQLTTSRLVRSLFFGGAFSLQGWLAWSAMVAAQQDVGPGLRAIARSRGRKVDQALRHLPLGEADRVATGRRLDWWQEWLAHTHAGDPYWDQFDCADAVDKVAASVAMVTSWQDLFAPWQLEDWTNLPQDVDKRLVIAPWPREHPRMLKLYMREALGWLASQVLSEPSTAAPEPVRYYVTGAEEWRQSTEWPPTDTLPQAWYLQAGGGLALTHPDGGEPNSYRFDPADPTPSRGGPPARRNPRVRQDKIERRSDVITFTSTPLEAPLEAIGNVAATVYLRSSVERTDVVVRLCDVDPKGRSVNVCDGIQRVTPGGLPADTDGVRTVEVALWPTGHHFAREHRIRIQVASAAFPRFDRNPGTGEPLATATRLVAAHQEIFHDRPRPSHLTLPVRRR